MPAMRTYGDAERRSAHRRATAANPRRHVDRLETRRVAGRLRGTSRSASAAGATVDENSRVVRFPPSLVEQTIEYLRKEIASGRRQYVFNGVTNPRWTPPLGCKFGGACIEYLDPLTEEVRPPTEQDLIRLLQLGEALDGRLCRQSGGLPARCLGRKGFRSDAADQDGGAGRQVHDQVRQHRSVERTGPGIPVGDRRDRSRQPRGLSGAALLRDRQGDDCAAAIPRGRRPRAC